jgi:lysophospholipase L1-like esterase
LTRAVQLLFTLALAGCGGGSGGPAVFMGDSITAHWDEATWQIAGDPPETTSASVRLGILVPGSVDAGVTGQTSVQMLERFSTDVLARHPSTVVILAGTNDLYTYADPSISSVTEMAEEAAAAGVVVVIGLVPPSNNWLALHYNGQTGNDAIKAWNADLRSMAASYGYRVADYYSAMILSNGDENTALFYVDGIHPISAGYAVMWQVLQPVLPVP